MRRSRDRFNLPGLARVVERPQVGGLITDTSDVLPELTRVDLRILYL
jgi:hypothetical protein